MHYYQFNIGDYASHTSRLSIYEDLAYRRILDLYYLNERPLNGCGRDVAREIGMVDHIDSVEYILGKFFSKDDNGDWFNKRAEEEISAYKDKQMKASAAGKASGKARRSKASKQTTNGRSTNVQQGANERATKHKPITNNHKPITNSKTKSPSAPVDFSVFGMTDHQVSEVKRIRKLNKGGPITQRVANALSKEFHEAATKGFTFDELLTEWEVRGWKAFKAEWVKPKSGMQRSTLQQNIENLRDVDLPDFEKGGW